MSPVARVTINRHLIVLLPKQAALDWILRVDPEPLTGLTLDELRQDQDAFLVSEDKLNTHEDAVQWVLRRSSGFFDAFLNSWFTDEALWPQRRTRKLFQEWFDVQYHSTVIDLSTDLLCHEEWDENMWP